MVRRKATPRRRPPKPTARVRRAGKPRRGRKRSVSRFAADAPRPFYEALGVTRIEQEWGPCDKRERIIELAPLCRQGLLPALWASRKPVELQFDYICDQHRIAWEIDGRQHEVPVDHFGGGEAFQRQERNDRIKRAWAIANDYLLFRVRNYNRDAEGKVMGREAFLALLEDRIQLARVHLIQRVSNPGK